MSGISFDVEDEDILFGDRDLPPGDCGGGSSSQSQLGQGCGGTCVPSESSSAQQRNGCVQVLLIQGIFLAACGVYGAHAGGWEHKVLHSAYAGVGCGLFLFVCAGVTRSSQHTIGIHLALLGQVIFVGVFARQIFKSYGVPEKADRLPLFVLMAVGSAIALAAIIMINFKPRTGKIEKHMD